MSKTQKAILFSCIWALVCTFFALHGTRLWMALSEFAAGLWIISDWLSGRTMLRRSLGQIYQAFRTGTVPALTPASRPFRIAAWAVIAIALVLFAVRPKL